MIDPNRLPKRCMLDTGIWLRAFGHRPDVAAGACRAFYDAMLEQENVMLIAAPCAIGWAQTAIPQS